MESYFESQKDNIFRNVEVLIYVFDIDSKDTVRRPQTPVLAAALGVTVSITVRHAPCKW